MCFRGYQIAVDKVVYAKIWQCTLAVGMSLTALVKLRGLRLFEINTFLD